MLVKLFNSLALQSTCNLTYGIIPKSCYLLFHILTVCLTAKDYCTVAMFNIFKQGCLR